MSHETVDSREAKAQTAQKPEFVSPQRFYCDAVRREDIKRILDVLAK
jgi:hypothetical protein